MMLTRRPPCRADSRCPRGWKRRAVAVLVPVMALVIVGDHGSADEPEATANAKEFLQLARREAATYELRLEADGAPLELHSEPVLQWSNPVVGEIYGGIFLWTSGGRPAAAAAIFKWYSPHTHITHEFQSLSGQKLTATRDDDDVWTSPGPGVALKLLPDAPVPAATPAGRLQQMRRLARSFRATIDHRTEGTHELRLLTQPLYRYASHEQDGDDDALFAFVLGTDPEVLLVIESRRTAEGKEAWHYAPARMNYQPLRMTYDGVEVWNVPMLESKEVYRGEGPYVKFQFDDPPSDPKN